MNALPDSSLIRFAQASPLTVKLAEAVLSELLDSLRAEQIPVAAQSAMHDFYDRFLPRQNYFLHHFAPFLCLADQVFQVSVKRPRLLDLGCGVGTQTHLLATRGAQMTGLDNDPGRVDAGREMTAWFAARAGAPSQGVEWFAEDAFMFLEQQPADTFDGCFTQFALAYMRPHDRILTLIDRVVRPGGLILFREFNASSLYNRFVSKVDWLTAGDYRAFGTRLGWTLRQCRYHWLFPRHLVNLGAARQYLSRCEDAVTGWPPFGARLAASMTLVFQKASRSPN